MRKQDYKILLMLCAAFCGPLAGRALVINGETSANMNPPADDFGFANVARVWDQNGDLYASGVYLGNGYVLTAYHVVADAASDGGFNFNMPVELNHTNYTINPSTAMRLLTNPGTPQQTPADLAVFKLPSIPSTLPSLHIGATRLVQTTSVDMAGNGYSNLAPVSYDSSFNSTTVNPAYAGYSWDTAPIDQTIHWGINSVSSTPVLPVDDGSGKTVVDLTTYSAGQNIAQATSGDSGGGVFNKIPGAGWQLSGIMLLIDGPASQPSNTSVYSTSGGTSDRTYFADLSAYAGQINPLIPEPSAALQMFGGAGILLGMRRRRFRIV